MNRRLSLLAITVVLASGSGAAHSPAPAAIQELRTVYITVTDKDGLPVDDLTAEDFEVKEGGRPVEVTELGVATDPMQIALIVDDNGTGLFRSALAQFVRRLDGRAVMALSSVTGQTMKVVDYTPNVDAILRGVATLNARPGTPDGGQLLEGISEAAIELRRREAKRPIIIALTVGGEEHSTVHSNLVLDQLRESGTLLHVFSVERSALRSTMVAGRPKDLLQENMHLNRVLGDGPRQSGGRHQSIVATAGFIAGLQTLASELTSQYRLTYALPAGAKRTERLNVTVRRKGLQVRAPSKIPT